ncbi:MAG: YcaO-like family protein [Heliobacteriaceae bacterium]|nr:YcaO-like family protein [Heliobacteriaceae bacterium]
MQRIERRKAYKACDPFTTINRIRALLAACDLFTIEAHQLYTVPGVSCCRVMLGDSDMSGLNIGSNGKGLEPRYALASAYGEIMERLQNSILFPLRQLKFATRRFLETAPSVSGFRERLEREDLALDFHYGPDEVYLDTGALVDACSDVLAGLIRISAADRQRAYLRETFDQEPVACLPYYSVFQKQVRLLPIKLIWNTCGTNGMCAGNTPEEALIQGISEVFERFAIRSIYQQEITPPTIPAEYFANTEILARIRRLEETSGIAATIKDCSLGLGLPVIGLLLVDRAANKYTFHVGADPCPITALERCLTEIYQGMPQDVQARFHSLPVCRAATGEFGGKEPDQARRAAYYAATISGTGLWPESIFSDAATYPFSGFSHPVSLSDSEDLAYLAARVSDLGRDLFIRDVSSLGLPAYQVYIPGMSETDFIFEKTELPDWMNIVRNHRTLLNLGQAEGESIARLAGAISKTAGLALPVSFEPRRWFLSNVYPALQQIPGDFLLTLLFSRIAEYRAAAESLDAFMQSDAAQTGPQLYYRALHGYLAAKADGLPEAQIRESLTDRYGETVAGRVFKDFADPEQVFGQFSWPSCFDCTACEIESSCRYFPVLRKVKAVQRIQQANLPDQAALAGLFDKNHRK